MPSIVTTSTTIPLLSKQEVLSDYFIACQSREVSMLGRKDVFMGRAKFGIFGDGKELAQLAMAKVFRPGDFRSGYYRDQTFMAAVGGLTWQQYFAQLYAHADVQHDPFSAGRSMNGHYCNRWIDENGQWLNQTELYNSIMDISPTAGQLPRAVGIGYASKLYRNNPDLQNRTQFSRNGNEVCFATIGDASTSEGMFLESINAAGVLQVPLIISIWDDGYGISVPIEYQTTKQSISAALAGFQRVDGSNGIEIIKARGWHYTELVEAYQRAARFARDEHVPVLVHVYEVTQPQGHSASGSHERYKDDERLGFEKEFDCNYVFRQWILNEGFATDEELKNIEKEAQEIAKTARKKAWDALKSSVSPDLAKAIQLLTAIAQESSHKEAIEDLAKPLQHTQGILRKEALVAVQKALRLTLHENLPSRAALVEWLKQMNEAGSERYHSHVYSEFPSSPLHVTAVPAVYDANPIQEDGREIINKYFDQLFATNPLVFALGEDVGQIGDVNQGFAGLQEKYGLLRITDTGIRETTIVGQGIGAAMRGLRPIVEIQYFDYALASLTDDLACLRYRTKGQQLAPLIIRTRGHRLEGIWHSGSPMGSMLNSLNGIHILVPRNFVQAAGLYNTILAGDDPALMIECLNGYRVKETLPSNLLDIRVPLGVPEIIRQGTDLTIVTYGSMCRIVQEAAEQLAEVGISAEVIDIQTLLPFDRHHVIVESLKKTNRIIFADEDMPGGAASFMMQQVIDGQEGYRWLDAKPQVISATPHRPSYGTDGDYFSKPNAEEVFAVAYDMMHEANPQQFPSFL